MLGNDYSLQRVSHEEHTRNGPAIALPVPNRDREREARGTAQDLRLESSIRRRGRL